MVIRDSKGRFVKGMISNRKGVVLSIQTKKKISQAKISTLFNISKKGYYRIRELDGSFSQFHRVIMEYNLGRSLKKNEIVHHTDSNKKNNFIWNLELMNKKDHDKLEWTLKQNKLRNGYKTWHNKNSDYYKLNMPNRNGLGQFMKRGDV